MLSLLLPASRPRRIPLALGVLVLTLLAGMLIWPQDSALSDSAVSEEWVARYGRGPDDRASALAVDGSGNVYVTGSSGYYSPTDPVWDYASVKYGPDGSELWAATYNGPARGPDYANALAVDDAGKVYVTGTSCVDEVGYPCMDYDYATIKYGPGGSEQWVARYDGVGAYPDSAEALAVDGEGNVYVTGSSDDHVFEDLRLHADYATVKYGPDGSEEWAARYDGPVAWHDGASALAVDAAGNVYVTGSSMGCEDYPTCYDYATVKYGPGGSELWVARYDGPGGGEDDAGALAVDAAGNVYVTGHSAGSGTEADYATIKYGPDGTELWVARYDGPGSGEDSARALAVDAAGDVYVTGSSEGSDTYDDYATIKYGPDGSEQWVAHYDGRANALAVDGSGNVYVTGASEGDYSTIKYGPDGSQQWVARYDDPASEYDTAEALALDGAGYVYVTGCSASRGRWGHYCDYVTIKYSQALPPTPTPTPIVPGEVNALPAAGAPAAAPGSSGGSAGVVAGITAAAAGLVGLGGAAWWARRRRAA